MQRNLNALAETHYDVLVAGCGIYGAAAVREAALRGLKTAVIDARDFCGATSANSLKIIHGGLRYLQQLDIPRVRESAGERTNMMVIAPHIVHPLPCVMPTHGYFMRSQEAMAAGLLLYELVTIDQQKPEDPQKHFPRGRTINRDDLLDKAPGLDAGRISGGAEWYDAIANNTERLAVSMVRSAADAGADAANYLKMTGFIDSGNRITGIKAKDMLSGNEIEIRADLTLVNTGPWTNHALSMFHTHLTRPIKGLALGMNFVLGKKLFDYHAVGLSCPKHKESGERLLFFVPWHDTTMVGTYYRTHNGHPDELEVTDEDISLFIKDINTVLPRAKLEHSDIAMIHAGLLPTRKPYPSMRDPDLSEHNTIIDHGKTDSVDGVISIAGVKYTTARHTAEKTIDLALRKLGKHTKGSESASTPLPGGNIRDFKGMLAQADLNNTPHRLVYEYGTEHQAILENSTDSKNTIEAEIRHITSAEMPETLADMIFRRTDIASAGIPDSKSLENIARIMGRQLDWDESRIANEIQQAESVQFPGSETF